MVKRFKVTIIVLIISVLNIQLMLLNTGVYARELADIQYGPTVNMLTQNSVVIAWWTTTPGFSRVRFGLDSSVENVVENSTLVKNHEVKLKGLEFNTTYYYQVETAEISSDIYQFHTAKGFTDPFMFAFLGDNRPQTEIIEQPEVFSSITNNIIASSPDLVMHGGDDIDAKVGQSSEIRYAQWKAFRDITDQSHHNTPWIFAIGNHDDPENYGPASFTEIFTQPTDADPFERFFSFDYGNSHFIVLDTERDVSKISGAQWEWLVQDLAKNTAIHTFILFHRPLSTPYIYPVLIRERGLIQYPEGQKLLDLALNHSITAFLVGHDHMYNHKTVGWRNITQIVSAGAGAPLYVEEEHGGVFHHVELSINWKKVGIKVILANGILYDEYQIDTPYTFIYPNRPNITSILANTVFEEGQALDVEVIATALSPEIQLWYSNHRTDWNFITMSMSDNSTHFTGSIPNLPSTNQGTFYIRIVDKTGNFTVSDLYNYVVHSKPTTEPTSSSQTSTETPHSTSSTTTTVSTPSYLLPTLFTAFFSVSLFHRWKKRKKSFK